MSHWARHSCLARRIAVIEHIEQLLSIVNVQFGINMAHVRLDRIGRNHELLRDIRHTAPGNKQVENFFLAFSEKIPRGKKAHILGHNASFIRQHRSTGGSLSRVSLVTFTGPSIADIPLGKLFLINNGNMQITQKPRA